MNKPIKMGDFFDSVHKDYDEVHTSHINNGSEFYIAISKPITSTIEKIRVLNIGCGTGLEFESILKKIPFAQIDCIDLSLEMLNLLKERLNKSTCQLNTFCCSYLDFKYEDDIYDYIIASATLHHLLDDEKMKLFTKIFNSLKIEGTLIVGDRYSTIEESKIKLEEYEKYLRIGLDVKSGQYHVDIPTTVENEQKLLEDTGFKGIKIIWYSKNYTIITAAK